MLSRANVCLRALGPVHKSLEIAAEAMRNLALENVNGKWRGFTSRPDDVVVALVAARFRRQLVFQRRSCDFCWLTMLVCGCLRHRVVSSFSLDSSGLTPFSQRTTWCYRTRVGSTNRCAPCKRRGLPCSWSYISVLFGHDWHWQVERMEVLPGRYGARLLPYFQRSPRLAEVERAICCQPGNDTATTTRRLQESDVRFVSVERVNEPGYRPR